MPRNSLCMKEFMTSPGVTFLEKIFPLKFNASSKNFFLNLVMIISCSFFETYRFIFNDFTIVAFQWLYWTVNGSKTFIHNILNIVFLIFHIQSCCFVGSRKERTYNLKCTGTISTSLMLGPCHHYVQFSLPHKWEKNWRMIWWNSFYHIKKKVAQCN